MIHNQQLNYYELTGAEFVQGLGAARPILCATWAEVQAHPDGVLRAVQSGLLPWTSSGQTVDVLAWPNGQLMVSRQMWYALGGT